MKKIWETPYLLLFENMVYFMLAIEIVNYLTIRKRGFWKWQTLI